LGVFYSLGFQVIIVWESDWNRDREAILARVHNKLGVAT